jgi:hypothetical protein
MELTLTQSSALYLAQHKISKRRTAFFQRWRAVLKNQVPDLRRQAFLQQTPRATVSSGQRALSRFTL